MPVDDKSFTEAPTCPVCGKNLAPPGAMTIPAFCPSCGSDTQQPTVKARRRDPRLKFTAAEQERRRKHGG